MIRVLIFFFIIGLNSVDGQRIIVSNDININKAHFYDILGLVDNNYIIIRDINNDYFMDVYNDDMTFVKSQELLVNYKRKNIIGSVGGSDYFNLFFEHTIDKQPYFQMHRYSKSGILIDSMSLEYENKFHKRYKFVNSADKSCSLLFKLENDGWCDFYVFDNREMKVLWQKHIKLKKNIRTEFRRVLVNSRGDIIILSEIGSKLFSFSKEVFTANFINKNYESSTIISESDDFYISDIDIDFSIVDDSNFFMNGFTEEEAGSTNGSFHIEGNFNSFQTSLEIVPNYFNDKLLDKVYKLSKTRYDYIQDLEYRECINQVDGGYVMIGEVVKEYIRKNRRRSFSNLESNAYSNWTDYNHKDIFVISFDKNNQMTWVNILHKNQFSQDDNVMYSSFFIADSPRHIRFLFSDNTSNNSVVSEFLINGLGTNKRNTIFNTQESDLRFRFKEAVQIDYKTLIVPSQIGSIVNLVKFEFD